MRLLYEKILGSNCECLLMEAGGAVVARVTFCPDGTARSSCADHPLTGRWRLAGQELSVAGADGQPLARFNAEGLDEKGRRLLWGSVRVGASWLRYSLRELPSPAHYPSISLCVACKGRLHHLRETLPRNLLDNADYPNLELVVLDYNSTDGLGDWMERNLRSQMDAGRVSYFRSRHPRFFNISHAKNLALRLAGGDIIGIVDADNFTGKGYAYYVADNVREDNCLVGCRMAGEEFQPVDDEGCVGRFALRREAFYEIGGMNEELVGWGFEDIDFYSRLMAKGYRCQPIAHQYTTCIPHTDAERSRELEFPDTGRGSPTAGTCFINSERSKENLAAGKIVSNAGRIGCGSVRNGKNEVLAIRERQDPSLSICIVCRGEESILERTLPQNLAALRFYPSLEVVVLATGESGGTSWPPANFGAAIESGRLALYRLDERDAGNGAGSASRLNRLKNLCLRLARGQILCSASPHHLFGGSFLRELLRRHYETGIGSRSGRDYFLVARHLFAAARGLREDLTEEAAVADLLARLARQWAPGGGPASLAAGTDAGFGTGVVWRGGERVAVGPQEFPRISFAVSSIGSPAALKETLPRNLRDNRFYPNLEFVLLDCSGGGDLGRWIAVELGEYLASGQLVYRRHGGGGNVRPGLARNLALRAASGEYLCSLDADSLTGRDFAFHVAAGLQNCDFLSGCLYFGSQVDSCYDQLTAGRIAFSRAVFERVGGLDERIAEARRANLDLLKRLEALGLRGEAIDERFLRTVTGHVSNEGEKSATTQPGNRPRQLRYRQNSERVSTSL
jgi:glycosyltransferase involved in cell wall biosynthesis